MAAKTKFSDLAVTPPLPEKCCAVCSFSLEIRDPKSGAQMRECRAMPPSVFLMQTQGGVVMHSKWPVLSPQEWCFGFQKSPADDN